MKIEKWIENNTKRLDGKNVAITGSTGGIGRKLCFELAKLGASLILMDRNSERSENFCAELKNSVAGANVRCIRLDLTDKNSVVEATQRLKEKCPDVMIHNAGAYSVPRFICDTGLDNVFQTNFASPYYMIREILPEMRKCGGKFVVVGSIAHTYSKTDTTVDDFSEPKRASKVYGNSKRYLMFSLYELFKNENEAHLAVTHPGITFTNITAHYPKPIFVVIKNPMKVIFMSPRKACLSILKGVFEDCGLNEWIGPHLFNVWGMPKKSRLNTCSEEESKMIAENAEKVYMCMAKNERFEEIKP